MIEGVLRSPRAWAWLLAGTAVVAAAMILLSGAGHRSDEPVTLLCGAGMRPAMEEIIAAYRLQTGHSVRASYGASNLLLGQLKLRGDIADLFLPGDAHYVREASQAGLVADETPIGWFIPAIMVRPDNPHGLTSLADLARDGLRLALADERSAAIGRLMPALLQRNGMEGQSLSANTVFTAATAHELAGAVALGHVDATVVWGAVARLYEPCEVVEIAPQHNVPAPLSVALVAGSPRGRRARQFMEFLQSPAARDILRSHHYEVDAPPATSTTER